VNRVAAEKKKKKKDAKRDWNVAQQVRRADRQKRRKRGDQVDSEAESPGEPDWSADDDSDGDDDCDGEERIDWALLSQEEGEGSGAGDSSVPLDAGMAEAPSSSQDVLDRPGGPTANPSAAAEAESVPDLGVTAAGSLPSSGTGREASPSPAPSTAPEGRGIPRGLQLSTGVLGKRQDESGSSPAEPILKKHRLIASR